MPYYSNYNIINCLQQYTFQKVPQLAHCFRKNFHLSSLSMVVDFDDDDDDDDNLSNIKLKLLQVEQIKRENKLWTNDSLFLREYLLIPIASENENDLPEDCEIVEVDNTLRSRSSSQKSRSNSQVNGSDNADSTHTPSKPSSEPEETKETSGKDFLSKFDNSFAVLKSNVKKMEQNTR